jgi:hypothetical protein
MLNPNEQVFVVAKQSRLKPGGSAFTPNIVFGTDRYAKSVPLIIHANW